MWKANEIRDDWGFPPLWGYVPTVLWEGYCPFPRRLSPQQFKDAECLSRCVFLLSSTVLYQPSQVGGLILRLVFTTMKSESSHNQENRASQKQNAILSWVPLILLTLILLNLYVLSAHNANLKFLLGCKHSYDFDCNYKCNCDSVASENQPLVICNDGTCIAWLAWHTSVALSCLWEAR